MRELGAPIDADVFEIKVLKRPIPTLMESNQDRHHLTRMQASRTPPGSIGVVFGRQCVDFQASYSRKKSSISQKSDTILIGELLLGEDAVTSLYQKGSLYSKSRQIFIKLTF